MNRELWPRVERLFHATLEQTREARPAFLDRECGDETELRRELEILLAQDENAGTFLEIPAMEHLALEAKVAESIVGKQVGPYLILSLLGSGGMGEVYRAHDGQLGRDVAIKTLPHEFARDSQRLARLRREACTLASLNHANIAAIYGLASVGEGLEAVDCLVMELVEGDVLRGPLPVPQALGFAGQIADALEAAHRAGIVHRDLKPANVKVTVQGRVKVLDFGLAKALKPSDGGEAVLQPRVMGVLTLEGHIAGTPGYMSPEQARGEDVDQRTDIWALGCLLFELLTGKRAFAPAALDETLGDALERDPDWDALPSKTPASIRNLLRQCLERDVKHRPQDIAEVRFAIQAAQLGWNRWRTAAVLASSFAILTIGVAVWLLPSRDRVPQRSEWVQLTKLPDAVGQPALSPDGRTLAFVRGSSTYYALGQIYVKSLPDGEPVQLTGDRVKKMSPAFSPDGARVAYTVIDQEFNWDTWIVPTQGGEPRRLLRNATSLTWSGPRQLLFSAQRSRGGSGTVSADEARTAEKVVYSPLHDRGMSQRSQASPDGKWVLVAELTGYGNWGPCRVVPMDGSSPGRQVGPPAADCTSAAWSPDGKWMYLTSKAGGFFHIWRQRFPEGQPEQFTSGLTEEEGIAMAPDGRSIVTAVGLQSSSIWVHDRNGERQISVLEGNAAYPQFTPDGKKLCYRILAAVPRSFGTNRDPGEVWVADLHSGRSQRLTPGFQALDYALSTDSKQAVLEAPDSEGKPRLWLAPLDGRSPLRQIPGVEGRSALFAPTGEIFFRRAVGSSAFLYRVKVDGTGLRRALEQPILHLYGISPDGRWIAAWAPAQGKRRSAVQIFPLEGGAPILIGSNTLLQWSSTGDTIWISGGPIADDRTYIVPLKSGQWLPQIPREGFRSEQEIADLPGAHWIDAAGSPGRSPEVYAFSRRTVQRNLYRIPVQ